MNQERLLSTGRPPALNVAGVRALLERYMDGSNISVAELAAEQSLTTATVRKYLKAAGLTLPRGQAARKPREIISPNTLLRRMSTEVLIGSGRAELLRRRIENGQSMTSLAKEFGISRDRVRNFRVECGLGPEAPASSEETEAAEETDSE